MRTSFGLVAALLAVACSASPGDSSEAPDAGSATDAGADAAPAPSFGAISGECGPLAAELDSPQPSERRSRFQLPGLPGADDVALLDDGTRTILDSENAGGSSRYSEAFAFELLSRCVDAELEATENQIEYDPDGDKTDFLIVTEGERIGVSVARVMSFPLEAPYPEDSATPLLSKKLEGIIESSANVVPEQAWRKQILGLVAYGDDHADAVDAALAELPTELLADTVIWTIVTDGDDSFIYCDGPCDQ
ncbi:MAG: hypothetical protein KJO07_21880 [Deltaproteobacteria bacterium]|nr:hypothetical protein [Deltaproteobacteria bacterium]